MLVIMDELQENQNQHDVSNINFHSLFFRIRSDELNDIGYRLSRISPITLERDAFQTPKNKTQDTAPTSTPRKKRNKVVNKAFPVTWCQDERSKLGPSHMMQRHLLQAMVELNSLVDSYHHDQLMQITLQLDHQKSHRISTKQLFSMGRQQVQTNPGVLTPKGHLVNQHKQGSPDQHRLHPKRSHRQKEHKLCLHHLPGDQL